MNARSVLEYAKSLCSDIDAGRPLTGYTLARLMTPLAIPAALSLAIGLPACREEDPPDTETNCTDGVDNDEDGDIDCDDGDCFEEPACTVAAYGMPFEEECDDGIDNDSDGLTDCADADCACELYGVPSEVWCACVAYQAQRVRFLSGVLWLLSVVLFAICVVLAVLLSALS